MKGLPENNGVLSISRKNTVFMAACTCFLRQAVNNSKFNFLCLVRIVFVALQCTAQFTVLQCVRFTWQFRSYCFVHDNNFIKSLIFSQNQKYLLISLCFARSCRARQCSVNCLILVSMQTQIANISLVSV